MKYTTEQEYDKFIDDLRQASRTRNIDRLNELKQKDIGVIQARYSVGQMVYDNFTYITPTLCKITELYYDGIFPKYMVEYPAVGKKKPVVGALRDKDIIL